MCSQGLNSNQITQAMNLPDQSAKLNENPDKILPDGQITNLPGDPTMKLPESSNSEVPEGQTTSLSQNLGINDEK